jgi:RNA polymerase sigma factor (sigma-70 family)
VRTSSEAFSGSTLSELVAGARDGDERAWRELCSRVKNVAWKTINSYGVRGADADDAYAATMFRLAEHLDRIRDPERVPGWVATTARNETLGLFRSRRRTVVVDEVPERDSGNGEPDAALVRDELREAVRRSFALLDERCQRLLRILTADPPIPYEDVGAMLEMPHGSIGPTRRRCLDTLRSKAPLRSFLPT